MYFLQMLIEFIFVSRVDNPVIDNDRTVRRVFPQPSDDVGSVSRKGAWRAESRLVGDSLASYLKDGLSVLQMDQQCVDTSFDEKSFKVTSVEARVPAYYDHIDAVGTKVSDDDDDSSDGVGIGQMEDHSTGNELKQSSEYSPKSLDFKKFGGNDSIPSRAVHSVHRSNDKENFETGCDDNSVGIYPNRVGDEDHHVLPPPHPAEGRDSTDTSDIDRRINALQKFLDKAR
jgi:hypothetical protein